ncbi:hypothetical protein [Legionella fairfieldensis]|uniref:hypothetical protein n=1 Tax=Legionella fairfieldensis TaxID=45064 RepID=UPI000490E2E8|nr:hypothetical protein [Legionella fairfieldensis]
MENLVYILKLQKKYNGIYFIKKSLCQNSFRKLLGVFIILLIVSSIIAIFIAKKQNNIYILSCPGIIIFLSLCYIFKLIDKDHMKSINQPLTTKFLNPKYLVFRIQAIKETLQKDNCYNENFLNQTLEECDRYLILEANGTSFILRTLKNQIQ